MSDEVEESSKPRHWVRNTVVVSIVWVVGAIGYAVWPCLGSATCERLRLGELGDFVAGVAAPVAFLWFVIAVFMQRDELEMQRRQLSALLVEQRRSTAHQAWQKETEALRDQPNLLLNINGPSPEGDWFCHVMNVGATVSHLRVTDCSPDLLVAKPTPEVPRHPWSDLRIPTAGGGGAHLFSLRWSRRPELLEFTIVYSDASRNPGQQTYRYLKATHAWSRLDEKESQA